MYIFQKTYQDLSIKEKDLSVVLLLPSSAQQEMVRFSQIVENAIREINKTRTRNLWSLRILSHNTNDRSPANNFSEIYNAKVIIAECSEKKPNVFYMLGLAHAVGTPVCSCYRLARDHNIDIPFNVHGRQSLTYSLVTTKYQQELKNQLIEWILKNEEN